MELFQVRYFLALAKTLNFTRAAESCNVSQPALTRAIQRLEEELGGPLLYRERNLTQLTELGRAMLPHLEGAYMAAEAATAQAVAFKRRDAAPLRLGLDSTVSARLLTPVLRELQDRIRGFELTLVEGNSDELATRLLDADLDGAVLVEPEKLPDRLNRWRLFEEAYVVIVSREHRFAALDAVPMRELAHECLLMRARPGSDFDRALEHFCAAAGVEPRGRSQGTSEDHIQHMAGAGLGVAIASAHQPLAPDLVARPLDPGASRRVAAVAVAGRPHGPGLAAFLKLVRVRSWDGANPSSAYQAAPASRQM